MVIDLYCVHLLPCPAPQWCVQVVKKLQAQFGDLYNTDNVILSGTHTHSGPAGFFQYVLFEVTSLGFVKESLDAVVDGIVQSIAIGERSLSLTLAPCYMEGVMRTFVVQCCVCFVLYSMYCSYPLCSCSVDTYRHTSLGPNISLGVSVSRLQLDKGCYR